MRISHRAQSIAPFYAMEFGKQAAALEAQGHRVVKLSLGEPDFGAPPAVLAAMREAMDGRPLTYTAALGLPALRQAIADFYADRHHVDVAPARVVVTAGASAALVLATAALVDPGDEVLIADPSYPCNRQIVESFGARVTLVPTTAASRYQLDTTAVAAAWTDRTRGLMIATPSNPTGTSVPPDELAALCALAREREAWRLVDEIYLDLADHDTEGAGDAGDVPPPTALSHDPDAVVINSFSKYFGMTGWRLGWCVVPEPLVPALERLAQNYFLCASAPAQQAALACFTPRVPRRLRGPPRRVRRAPRPGPLRPSATRPAGPGPARRRVLRLLRRHRHRPHLLGLLRPRPTRGPRRPHPRQGLRRPHGGNPRTPVLRGIDGRPEGGTHPPGEIRDSTHA